MRGIVFALAAALLLKAFVFDFMRVDGVSMSPALSDGQVIIVNRLAYGFRLPLSRGYLVRWAQPKAEDIVVFYTPDGDLAIKRCAAFDSVSGTFTAAGDNALRSYDSRSYGPVSVNNIIGKRF